jgi:hypothetical protein
MLTFILKRLALQKATLKPKPKPKPKTRKAKKELITND